MRQLEIARVQWRKFTQQHQDLATLLRDECEDLLAPSMTQALVDSLDQTTWIVGHDYHLAEEQSADSALEPAVALNSTLGLTIT